MSVTFRFAAVALVAGSLFHMSAARAQTQQQKDWCASKNDATQDQRISSCSEILQSGAGTENFRSRVLNNRGNAYKSEGQYDRAIQDYDQAIRLDQNYAVTFLNRGVAYSGKTQYDHAIQDYDQAIKLNPNSALAFHNRGAAYSKKNEFSRAIQNYDQAIKLNPDYAAAFYNRAVAKQNNGDEAGAEADVAAAREINPNIGK